VELFGRHIFRSSPRLLGDHAGWTPHLAGEAKVSERSLPLDIEEDVPRFHITMNESMAVGCMQPISNLEYHSHGLRIRHPAAMLQDVFKRFMQQRHHEIQIALAVHTVFSGVVDGHEMGMPKGSYPACFCTEAIDVIAILRE
jgi:hypothetical protein